MSEPKPINLLQNPIVWTGPAIPGSERQQSITTVKPLGPKPETLKDNTEGINPASCGSGLPRPDPFSGLPYPFTPGGEAMRLAGFPAVNMTPELEEQIKNSMSLGLAARANADKPRWGLLALEVFEPVVQVLMFGAKKYAAWNFTNKEGLSWTETGESMQRHLSAWMRGEDLDPESGLPHLGHIGCNLMFLLYYRMYASKGYDKRDDRFKR